MWDEFRKRSFVRLFERGNEMQVVGRGRDRREGMQAVATGKVGEIGVLKKGKGR